MFPFIFVKQIKLLVICRNFMNKSRRDIHKVWLLGMIMDWFLLCVLYEFEYRVVFLVFLEWEATKDREKNMICNLKLSWVGRKE